MNFHRFLAGLGLTSSNWRMQRNYLVTMSQYLHPAMGKIYLNKMRRVSLAGWFDFEAVFHQQNGFHGSLSRLYVFLQPIILIKFIWRTGRHSYYYHY